MSYFFEIFKKIEIVYYTKSNKKIILLLVYGIIIKFGIY